MKIKVYNEKENKFTELKVNNIQEIVEQLNINLEEVIITKNNELTTEKTKLNEGDEIKFLSVISGG
jgi:sulfur carrier protein ThiS